MNFFSNFKILKFRRPVWFRRRSTEFFRRKIPQGIVLVRWKGFPTNHIPTSSVDRKFRWKIHVPTEKFAFLSKIPSK